MIVMINDCDAWQLMMIVKIDDCDDLWGSWQYFLNPVVKDLNSLLRLATLAASKPAKIHPFRTSKDSVSYWVPHSSDYLGKKES